MMAKNFKDIPRKGRLFEAIQLAKDNKPDWAVDQVTRASGLIEDICEHGVGHPNGAWMEKFDPGGHRGWGIHGCDGCCKPKEEPHDNSDSNDSE